MSKAFDMIKAGMDDAIAFAEGRADKSKYGIHVPSQVDVKAIRRKLKMSQEEFAQRFSFTPARIRDWEQGRSKPDGAARAYLMVIQKERKAVERALKAR
jgi:putative transcriptional regulator